MHSLARATVFFVGVGVCLGVAESALSAQPLPLAPLDEKLARVKSQLWPAEGLGPAKSGAEAIHVYTRVEAADLILMGISLRLGDETRPMTPVGRGMGQGGGHRSEWWYSASVTDADSPPRLVYTLRAEDSGRKIIDSTPLPGPNASSPSRYELILGRDLFGQIGVRLVEWRPKLSGNPIRSVLDRLPGFVWGEGVRRALHHPGAADDPSIRYASARCASGYPLSGLTVLWGLSRAFGHDLGPAYGPALARCLLSAGMRRRALEAISQWAGPGATGSGDRVALLLDVAEVDIRRGAHARAEATLRRLADNVTDESRVRWRDLLSRALFSQGRLDDGAELLADLDATLDQDWSAPGEAGRQLAHMRYNLGVATIRRGGVAPGRTLLDLLGKSLDSAPDLRDQANLVLGWHLLKDRRGASAKHVLSRVRLNSAQAPSALLAYGWANLVDPGDPIPRARVLPGDVKYKVLSPHQVDELYAERKLSCPDYNRLTTLPLTPCPRGGETYSGKQFVRDLQPKGVGPRARAIAIWSALVERDARHPAVIEGGLALAGRLIELGALAQAQAQLKAAIVEIDIARSALRRAQADITAGTFLDSLLALSARDGELDTIGWVWAPASISASHAAYFLSDWLARNRSLALLQLVRDARLLRQAIESGHGRGLAFRVPGDAVAGELHASLENVEAVASALFRAEATVVLSEHSRRLHEYRIAGLLKLAHLHHASR